MKTIKITDISKYDGQEVRIQGWVRNWRKSSSKLRFIILRDGSGDVQAVAFKPELGEEIFDRAKSLTIESSVEVTGIVNKHPKKEDVYELNLTGIFPYQIAIDYPISNKEHGTDFLLSNRHLWIRSRRQWALLRIRHNVYYAICDYLNDDGFIRFDSPILTPNACEGTTTLFEVPYFDLGTAYLSQSGQLYLETAALSHGKAYDFGPVFRAEKSKTRKHLTEFWMMDAEMAWCDHKMNMELQENLVRHIIRTVIDKCPKELAILERNIEKLKEADAPFVRMTHREAIDILKAKGVEIGYSDDLGTAEEDMLLADSPVPIFIEKWPKAIKAFYMKRDPENDDLVLGSDLLAPEGFGEIIGGSQREDNLAILEERIAHEKLPAEEFNWFTDLRRYGSVPHAGFGIGLERMVCWMSGVSHVREAIPFPRMIYRLRP